MKSKFVFKKSDIFLSRTGEQSFSLFETVIAIGMLAAVLVSVNAIQGNAIYSVEYQENLSKATWLAKGLMSKVEYEWNTREFKELDASGNEQNVNDLTWGDGAKEAYNGFTYKVKVEEWKLPLMKLLLGGLGGEEEGSAAGGFGSEFIEAKVKEVLGDELLKVAHVEVFWPEGATRGSTDLTMALTNQKALDKFISTQKGIAPVPQDPPPGTPPPGTPPPGTPPSTPPEGENPSGEDQGGER